MTTYIRADTAIRNSLRYLADYYATFGSARRDHSDFVNGRRALLNMFPDGARFESLAPEAQAIVLSIHAHLVAAYGEAERGEMKFYLMLAEENFTHPNNAPTERYAIPNAPGVYLALMMNMSESGYSGRRDQEQGPQAVLYGYQYVGDVIGRVSSSRSTPTTPVDTTGVVLTNYNGWRVLQPENMDAIPRGMREYAAHTYNPRRADSSATFEYANGVSTLVTNATDPVADAMRNMGFTNLSSLLTNARAAYREALNVRRADAAAEANAEFERKRREHAAKSARNFETFRSTNMCQDQLIPTLPFVPHGLAASRRWGIEVESGGARGVKAPEGWNRKRDGSLRSAWDGHTEVQDFEPFDEEVTDNISWYDCERSDTHVQYVETWDAEAGLYRHSESPEFVSPDDCEHCGTRTRMVRREPQTITHSAQNDDCAEFVSPILTSMHSNGLEKLVGELSKQPQNDTAGVHVHVESDDLTDEQIAVLVYGYDQIERFIEASYQRGRRDYAQRQPSDRVLRAARDLKRGKVGDWVRQADRYLTVNVQALRAHGTIEFRAMGPVYNYDHLIRWAMFCREMVNVVKGGATYKEFGRIKKWGDLLAIFAKYGKEYTRAAVYELTGETGQAAKLSKENVRMTADALNADLESVILGLENLRSTLSGATPNLTEAFRAMAAAHAAIPNVTAIRRMVQPNLVSTTRTLESV